jgi:homogentisate 1,2-dioxygenase
MMGNIPFEYGDYLLSRGSYLSNWFWYSSQSIAVCRIIRYLYAKTIQNESGQHLEHAPFCERDFILPTELETHDEKGDFLSK